jgi:glycosyltransferase involved in cell wall biosynthesis
MMQRVLVVIPAYNEVATIGKVLERLRVAAPGVDRLVVTDGSRDGTADAVRATGERHLDLVCNVGYGRALQAGMLYALRRRYDVVVTIDADGQHDPGDVPRLLHALEASGADVVIGSRFVSSRSYTGPLGRRIGQATFSMVTRVLMGKRIYDTTSGLKAMRSEALAAALEGRFLDFHTEVLVRLSMLGFRIEELPIVVAERHSGQSMHSLFSGIAYPVKTSLFIITGMLDALLRGRSR